MKFRAIRLITQRSQVRILPPLQGTQDREKREFEIHSCSCRLVCARLLFRFRLLVHGPKDGVGKHSLEVLVLEIIGMPERGIEDATVVAVCVCPGDWFGFVVFELAPKDR